MVELQKAISDKPYESDRIVQSLTGRLESEMEALKIRHAEELACAQQGGNEQQEDTELLIATIKAENDKELKKMHEDLPSVRQQGGVREAASFFAENAATPKLIGGMLDRHVRIARGHRGGKLLGSWA